MGASMAPNYVNVFTSYAETQLFSLFTGFTLELYGSYINDCIGIPSLSGERLDPFLSFVWAFHYALKFICIISNFSIEFFDIF